LLIGYATDQKVIGDKIIREVASSLNGSSLKKTRRGFISFISIPLGIIGLGTLIFLSTDLFLNIKWGILKWAQTFQGILEELYREIGRKVSRF